MVYDAPPDSRGRPDLPSPGTTDASGVWLAWRDSTPRQRIHTACGPLFPSPGVSRLGKERRRTRFFSDSGPFRGQDSRHNIWWRNTLRPMTAAPKGARIEEHVGILASPGVKRLGYGKAERRTSVIVVHVDTLPVHGTTCTRVQLLSCSAVLPRVDRAVFRRVPQQGGYLTHRCRAIYLPTEAMAHEPAGYGFVSIRQATRRIPAGRSPR